MSVDQTYFETLFAQSDDPWSFRTRWYERRKRDLCMAMLPRQHYARIFEPACANGELSVLLAARSDSLLAQDLNPRAVALANERLAPFAQARAEQAELPQGWPEGQFDLIVLGEIGYYLTAEQWQAVVERARASLTPQGGLLACHWLPPIAECPQTGREVHDLLHRHLGMHRLARHEEGAFLLEYWTVAPFEFDLEESVA